MDYCETPSLFGYVAEFLELSRIIMQRKNLTVPKNATDAKTLYIMLIQEIEKLQKLDVYVINYLFHSVLTWSEEALSFYVRALNTTITDG